jgi:hypothetical protein
MKKFILGSAVALVVAIFAYSKMGTAGPALQASCGMGDNSSVKGYLNEKCDLSKSFSLAGYSGGVIVCCVSK